MKPFLKGRPPKKTEEHFKEYEKMYNNTPERKAFMKQYRRRPEARIKENESSKRYRERNPEVAKNGHLKRNFGLSLEDYNKMLEEQNNVCAICKNPEVKIFKKTGKLVDFCVDHCHKTGKIRGLLCWNCNTSIGKFKDSIEILQNAIDYLKKNQDE